jgi:hypothetical protein
VQPDNQFKAEKTGIYMSADIDSRNGEVQVVAYLSNDVLIQEEGRRGRFFDQLVITSLYRFVHQSTGSNNTLIDKNLQLIYAEMGSKKITFFDIKSS